LKFIYRRLESRRGVFCGLFHDGDYKLVVRESEAQDYSGYDLLVFPDDEINSLSKVRQKIIDTSKAKLILQCDDDITKVAYQSKENYIEMTKDEFAIEIIKMFSILDDLRLGFWSVKPTLDTRQYNAPYTFKGVPGGIVGFNKEYIKSKYDERLFSRCDADFLLQETLKNRIAFIASYIGIEQKRDTNKGGNNVNKTENKLELADEIMKQKWGKNFDRDVKRNVIKLGYKR
jgi:hypothetical protein